MFIVFRCCSSHSPSLTTFRFLERCYFVELDKAPSLILYYLLLLHFFIFLFLAALAALYLTLVSLAGWLPLFTFDSKSDFWDLRPFRHLMSMIYRQKGKRQKKTKRQKYQIKKDKKNKNRPKKTYVKEKEKKTKKIKDKKRPKKRPKREFNIVTSEQFCILALFYLYSANPS